METSGCALCADVFAQEKLVPLELEVIRDLLASLTLDTSFVSTLRETSSVFCKECLSLLKETKRLHLRLQTVTSQLDSVLAKVKVKYEGSKSVWVKIEVDDSFPEDSELTDGIGFSIDPVVVVEDVGRSGCVKEDNEDPARPTKVSIRSAAAADERRMKKSVKSEAESQEKEENSQSSSGEDESWVSAAADASYSNASESESQTDGNEDDDDDDDDDYEDESSESPRKKSRVTRLTRRFKREDQKPRNREGQKGHYWLCGFCDLRFPTKDEKFLHDETIHFAEASDDVEGATRLYSSICGKSSMTPKDVTTHNETFHEDHLTFLCLSCNPLRKFISEDLLQAHYSIHSSKAPFSCSLCPPSSFSFDSSSHLDNHLLRLHSHAIHPPLGLNAFRVGDHCNNPPFPPNRTKKTPPCRFCGLQVTSRGLFAVRQHERKKHAEKFTHLCACSLTFAEEKELLTCKEAHRDASILGHFKCSVCNAKFSDALTLREHLEAIHTVGGIKCDVCQVRIVYSGDLQAHKARVHGGEWPFVCQICGKGARSRPYLDDHIRAAHKDQQPDSALLSCDQCDRKFYRRSALCRHKLEKHKGVVSSFACERCGKVLKSQQSLNNHIRTHLGVKNHVCQYCGKGFVNSGALTSHLRVHTGERPYVCFMCDEGFTELSSLKKHYRVHEKNGSPPPIPHPPEILNTPEYTFNLY